MNWCKYILIWLLGVLSGIAFFFIPKLEFSYEVKLIDILAILVTLTIAFLIQLYLVKKSDISRVEKDIIIEQAKVVRERFENARNVLYELYASKAVSTDRNKRILSVLKSLANSMETFEHSFTLAKGKFDKPRCKRLRNIYYAYKRELTNVDVRKPFADGTFQMSESIFNEANRELVSIILYVNQG